MDVPWSQGAKDSSGGSQSAIELNDDVWTLRQLIEQVTDISQKASSRGVDLVMNIANPEHFNTRFVGDFFRLRQCCVNLVDNAIKYSSNVNGRTALVEFTMRVKPGEDDVSEISFIVEDNGVGIPQHKQHTLFVPFCQPADHKIAKETGTGLGLVITKSIIEYMGGDIDFESVEDEFTKFFFTVKFPFLKATSNNGVEGEEEEMEKEKEEGDFQSEATTTLDESLPNNVRLIFHPAMRAATKKHVTCILKCFKGKAGVNYVSVPSANDLVGFFCGSPSCCHHHPMYTLSLLHCLKREMRRATLDFQSLLCLLFMKFQIRRHLARPGYLQVIQMFENSGGFIVVLVLHLLSSLQHGVQGEAGVRAGRARGTHGRGQRQ